MEIEVTEPVILKDGIHTGKIVDVKSREFNKNGETITYIDIHIKANEVDFQVKAGYPANISEKSGLGKVLNAFGTSLKVGTTLDPSKVLVGKEVSFQTTTKKTDRGEFSEVLKDTIKPK